jgi:hypothetical protein
VPVARKPRHDLSLCHGAQRRKLSETSFCGSVAPDGLTAFLIRPPTNGSYYPIDGIAV